MFKSKLSLAMFGLAVLCLVLAFVLATHATVRYAAAGATPTNEGAVSFILSILGACGFTVAGVANYWVRRWFPSAPQVSDETVAELVELEQSFESWLADRSNKAATRRFSFAIADELKLLPGWEVSHDNGVLILKYSGFADPTPSDQGVK